jgi:hypothetical protein
MRTKGLGPNNLGVDKRNLVSPTKKTDGPGKKSTELNTVTVVAPKGKGIKETTEVGSGYTGADYTAKRAELTKQGISNFNTKNNIAASYKPTGRNMSDIMGGVRTQLAEQGYTKPGARVKGTKRSLSPTELAQYNARKNK